MSDQLFKLGLYDTLSLTRGFKDPGVYYFPLNTVGNAVLSSVYVKSGTGTAQVNWFDYGASNIETPAARVDLFSHPPLTAGMDDRHLVSRLHNHARVELIVTGGPVEVFILLTLVADFPIEGEVSIKGYVEGEGSTPGTNTGIAISVLDPLDNKYYIAQGNKGALKASPSGLYIGGRMTEVSINPFTWTPLPATPLALRNALVIQNRSGGDIKINYDPTTSGYVGIVVPDLSERSYDVTENIVLYGKSEFSTVIINVEELA